MKTPRTGGNFNDEFAKKHFAESNKTLTTKTHGMQTRAYIAVGLSVGHKFAKHNRKQRKRVAENSVQKTVEQN